MIDAIKYIRENKEKVIDSIAKKNSIIDIPKLIELDVSKRNYLQNVEQLRSEKNKISSNISKLKKNGEDADQFIIDMQKLSIDIKNIESELIKLEKQINKILYFIPNMVHKSVPIGKDSKENIVVKEWGEKIEFSYKPKDHLELGKDLGLFNFIKAANISGSGFALYTNKGALLERALINLMLDLHTTKNEYSEIFPPFLVNPDIRTKAYSK